LLGIWTTNVCNDVLRSSEGFQQVDCEDTENQSPHVTLLMRRTIAKNEVLNGCEENRRGRGGKLDPERSHTRRVDGEKHRTFQTAKKICSQRRIDLQSESCVLALSRRLRRCSRHHRRVMTSQATLVAHRRGERGMGQRGMRTTLVTVCVAICWALIERRRRRVICHCYCKRPRRQCRRHQRRDQQKPENFRSELHYYYFEPRNCFEHELHRSPITIPSASLVFLPAAARGSPPATGHGRVAPQASPHPPPPWARE